MPNEQTTFDSSVVLNSGDVFASTTYQLKNKEKWILGGIGLAFAVLFIIIFSVFKSKKSKKSNSKNSPNQTKSLKRNVSAYNSCKKQNKNTPNMNSNNLDLDDMDEVESIYQKSNHLQQQQQVLLCNSNKLNEMNMQSHLSGIIKHNNLST